MSIRRRLALEYGAVIALSLLLGAFLLQRLGAMEADWAEYQRVTATRGELTTRGVEALSNAIHHFKNFVLRGGEYAQKFEGDLQALEGVAAKYRGTGALTAREEASLGAMSAGAQSYRRAMRKLVELRAQGVGAEGLDKAVAGADKPIAAALEELLAAGRLSTAAVNARIGAGLASARVVGLGLMAFLLLLGVAIAVRSTGSIVAPLQQAVRLARQVASGDLSARAEVRSRDETGQLLEALGEMTRALGSIVGQVRGASDAVEANARRISTGNTQLAARTTEQAASLEETASSMQELTATVQQNAQNARQADALAGGAAETARSGEAGVHEAVASMESIDRTSKKIAAIIGIIDEVAFQTSILALNASVEASRAGEHGRGFAVVAAEVRGLSERTTASAKEIKGLIAESAGGVQTGLQQISAAGKTMSELLAAVTAVADIVRQIASASVEQGQAIAQVTEALTRIQQVTHHNATLVENSAASATELDGQAGQLSGAVASFTLAPGATGRSRARGPEEVVPAAGVSAATQASATSRARGAGHANATSRLTAPPRASASAPPHASTAAPAGALPLASVPARSSAALDGGGTSAPRRV